jgi:hypothetical protein
VKQIARRSLPALGEDKGGLLRRKADAGHFRVEYFLQHPRCSQDCVEVGNSAILVCAEWIVIVEKLIRWHFLWIEILPSLIDAKDPICRRCAVFVHNYAGKVIRVSSDCFVWVSDTVAAHELQFEIAGLATHNESAIAVCRTHRRRDLHHLAKGIAPSNVATLAPVVHVFGNLRIIVAAPSARRVFGWR